jgi:glycosyltransferase involved in cell wall biosynthesis
MLSIVTITYRDPVGLHRTLESLRPCLNGSIPWEHVVVDQSPEETLPVLSLLPKTWPLVYLLRDPRGIYPAMNEGVIHSKGNFIWILNGGDCLRDYKVLKQILEMFKIEPELTIVCGAVDLMRDGKYEYCRRPKKNFFLSTMGICQLPHQGMIYRSEVFSKVGLFDDKFKIAADYHHHLRCINKGINTRTTELRLAQFDMSGVSSTQWRQSFDELAKIQHSMIHEASLFMFLLHEILRRYYFLKICIFKFIKTLAVSKVIRPIWLRWKRRKDSI